MRVLPIGLAAAATAAALTAQSPPISPAITKFTASSTGTTTPPLFPALSMSNTATATGTAQQLELRRLNTVNVNLFRVAFSMDGLQAQFGGVGGMDVAEAIYDAATQQVVQVLTTAASFNTAGREYSLSISEDGLVGVSDAPGGVAQWASRAAAGNAFGPTAPITGPVGPEGSKIYTQGTQLRFAFAGLSGTGTTTAIFAGDFNNGVVSNIQLVIPSSVVPGARGIDSPHPVTQEIPSGSGNWEVLGWYFSAAVARAGGGLDRHIYWLPLHDATVATSSQPVALPVATTRKQSYNGSSLGASGISFWPNRVPLTDPACVSAVAMNGDTFSAAGGGQVNLRLMVPWNQTDLWNAVFLFGQPIPPIPISFTTGNPFVNPTAVGSLGNTAIVAINVPVNPALPGGVTLSFPIAPASLPAGVPINMQAATINFTQGQTYLANTAVLEGL